MPFDFFKYDFISINNFDGALHYPFVFDFKGINALLGSHTVVVLLSGVSPLTLVNAKENGLNYLKLFGGTEQRNLPSEYTQVEYLESDGNQYIDTGYALTTDNFEISGSGAKKADAGIFFGARNATAPYTGILESRISNSLISFWTGNGWVGFSALQNTKYNFKIVCNSNFDCITSCSGFTDKTFTATQTYVNGSNVYLFGNNPYAQTGAVDIYALSIKDNGVLVRNLIPCRRNSDNVLGMYDTISGTFLTNAGTGTFTAGTDVVPSPDTPMDIVSNNGVIKAFKTLNISTYDTSASDAGIDIAFDGATDRRKWDTLNDYGIGTKHYENGFVSIYMTTNGNTYYVKALVNGIVYGGSVYNTGEQIDTWDYTTTKNIDIYCPTINADGTVETVQVTGKNLFNRATVTNGYYISAAGEIVANEASMYSDYIKVKPSTTYTISLISGSIGNAVRVHSYTSDKNWIEQLSESVTGVAGSSYSATFTTSSNAEYVRFGCRQAQIDIQVELGSTATDYVPYFDGGTATAEMLLKVGDVADEQEILSGDVTRKVGIKVFDGTEQISFNYAMSDGTLFTTPFVLPTDTACINSHGSSVVSITEYDTFNIYAGTNNRFFISVKNGQCDLDITKSASEQATAIKQWLADQYAAGTPVIVVYPLATATTESVTEQPLTDQAGTNIVEITQASIDDLTMEVSYKATV